MFNRIRDFLYSLKSEKAKRKIEEKAFAAAGEPPKPELGGKVRAWLVKHWQYLLTISVAIIGVAAAIANYFFKH